uniref:B mating type protein n=1 Tax=Ustilago esculenta TaxID=185366 RepID=A0A160EBF9_9BASI|nr:b mating type protein [Ustilago esculenta]QBH70106.1 homeodomain transcription factor bE3 [Ustilago esculenta]
MTFSFADLLSSLNDIETEFLEAEDGSPDLVQRLSVLTQTASAFVKSSRGDAASIIQIRRAAQRIQLVAETRIQLDDAFACLRAKAIENTVSTLESQGCKALPDKMQDLSETLPSYHMRKHFLATLDDPYPSQDDKETLVNITNESASHADRKDLNVHQLTLWFINARRRSGWSHILRKFACNDRNRMKLLIQTKMVSSNLPICTGPLPSVLNHKLDDVLRENLGRQLTAQDKKTFEDDWASMISWIKYGVKEKVGSWVRDLVAANKKTPNTSQGRAVLTSAKRTPSRKTATAQAKPRKAIHRASKTPSMDSNRDSSGMESTPELSTCSTADTSFSSLSSDLSMMHYNPFTHHNDVLHSPILNVKGERKVKALPKRIQKPSAETFPTDDTRGFAPGTCISVPEAHTLYNAQTAAYLEPVVKQYNFPPYDALEQAPVLIRTESLSSNSLSTAFG